MESKFFRQSSTPNPNVIKLNKRRRGSESEAVSGNVKTIHKRRGSVNVEISDKNNINREVGGRRRKHSSGADNSIPRRNSSAFDLEKFILNAKVIPEVMYKFNKLFFVHSGTSRQENTDPPKVLNGLLVS